MPGEQPFQITVQIGTPYQCGADPDEWAGPVAVSPLFRNLSDARAGDSFQALCLAAALAQDLLLVFKRRAALFSIKQANPFRSKHMHLESHGAHEQLPNKAMHATCETHARDGRR